MMAQKHLISLFLDNHLFSHTNIFQNLETGKNHRDEQGNTTVLEESETKHLSFKSLTRCEPGA